MKPSEIRENFLKYFEERDHQRVPSSPVFPQNDPTLLFTNAGMNQFKDLLLGNEQRDYTRATSVQKCIRAGGKHNDLDEVGTSTRHLTFFEMLGNWSFGDYYKEKSIEWAWDFVLNVLKLDRDRLYITVHRDDEESAKIWEEKMGVEPARILALGDEDNFWSMGPTGPCGPCTEIHYDLKPELGPFTFDADYDDNRINEIWNLVFMEFDRQEDGSFEPLPLKSVDTGMGLERAAMVVAGRTNVFHTELFSPIFRTLFELLGEDPDQDLDAFYQREDFSNFAVIADHTRSVTFSLCDGAQFSNEGRGYVLRRILRRAVRHGRELGFTEPFLYKIARVVVENFGDVYPELQATGAQAAELIRLEEERFFRNLDRGLALFEDAATKAQAEGRKSLTGDEVFQLHATFGFPPDLTEIMAQERGMTIDFAGYEILWEEHRQTSRAKDMHAGAVGVGDWKTVHEGSADTFIGYDTLETTTVIQKIRHVEDDKYELLLKETPFYAESGGQVGDQGEIRSESGKFTFKVSDTQKSPIGIVHQARLLSGSIDDNILQQPVVALVNSDARQETAANHTATHLLHAALQKEISDSIFQAGSLVAPDRLRFDFRYGQALTKEQLKKLEERVNREVQAGRDVNIHVDVERDTAVEEMGATAIFGEKYGDKVRVVQIPGESVELCGGTHVQNTAEIGAFRITSESSVGAGIRRIEAVTGTGAMAVYRQERALIEDLNNLLKTDAKHLLDRVQALLDEKSSLEAQVDSLSQRLADRGAADLLAGAQEIDGITVVARQIKVETRDQLLAYADKLRSQLGDKQAAILLGAELDGKAALLCLLTDNTFKERKLKAGDLINAVATHVDGRGGGRPTLAQAGGNNPAGLKQAVESFAGAVTDAIKERL